MCVFVPICVLRGMLFRLLIDVIVCFGLFMIHLLIKLFGSISITTYQTFYSHFFMILFQIQNDDENTENNHFNLRALSNFFFNSLQNEKYS